MKKQDLNKWYYVTMGFLLGGGLIATFFLGFQVIITEENHFINDSDYALLSLAKDVDLHWTCPKMYKTDVWTCYPAMHQDQTQWSDFEHKETEWTPQEETWSWVREFDLTNEMDVEVVTLILTSWMVDYPSCNFDKKTEWDFNKTFIVGEFRDDCSAELNFYDDREGVLWKCGMGINSDGTSWKGCTIVNYESSVSIETDKGVRE